MKLVKIFGIVMGFHAAAFMFIFAIPGCRSNTKKSVATASVTDAETSSMGSPVEAGAPIASQETTAVRFSPTRPGTPAAAEVAAPQPQAAVSTHTVVKGDNLWSIARKNGVTVKQLAAANKISADTTLKLGQKLVIPGKAAATTSAPSAYNAPAAPASPARATTITHVVKSGETLGVIAKKYQVKVGEIATANNIADPAKLRVGQSLKIPGGQATTAKPSAPAAKPAPTPAPALEPAAPAPLSPTFGSPVESAPSLSPEGGSPFLSPDPESMDAPIIRVEESGAPRIE